MFPVDAICGVDDVLAVQFKLAVASPLWKALPYGLQLNPNAWQIEVLKVRPGRRLSLRLAVPWSHRLDKAPLVLIMHLWHGKRSPWAHNRLLRFNALLREAERKGVKVPAPIFYDSLGHALVYPAHPKRLPARHARPLNDCWMKHLIQNFRKFMQA